MAANVAVVIPVYKENLSEFEKISLMQVKKVLGGKYPIIFFAPAGKTFSYFNFANRVIYFPPQFFQSLETYNALMMTADFYKVFFEYDYILIYQLDAFVFYDKLEYFCNLGYDYIGSPFSPYLIDQWQLKRILAKDDKLPRVGNGGFSLRNPKACYNLLLTYREWWAKYVRHYEDVFFAYYGIKKDSNFRAAPFKIALQFAVDLYPKHFLAKNHGELPFGCHAWYKCGAEFYFKAITNCGYNLSQLKNQMKTIEIEGFENWAKEFALKRLNRRLNHGQSLMRYLPKNNFASVRVIRTPYNMLILARLLLENNSLSDKIFFYEESEQDILIDDLKLEKLPHLLLTQGGGGAQIRHLLKIYKEKV